MLNISRVEKLQLIFNEKHIDALLVSNFYNILYLTGFKTLSPDEREAWVLATKKNIYLFTDGRYLKTNFQFSYTNPEINFQRKLIEPGKGVLAHLKEIIKNEQINILGVEGEDLKVAEYHKLQKAFLGIKIVPTEKLIVKLREIKEEGEIDKIKRACQITDNCLKEIIKIIKPGIREKEIAFKIEFWFKEKGYDLAFPPIIAVDKNSSFPHYNTKDGKGRVKNSSVVLIDFGVKYENYCSDITRMVFINPTSEIINIYDKLLSAQEKTINAFLSQLGQNGKDIDHLCRKMMADYHLPNYPHSTGHGVGLEIHEYPKISQNSSDHIHSGQVFTIEPGVYFERKWGMRIEDTVYINNNLKPEILTKFSKTPFILKIPNS